MKCTGCGHKNKEAGNYCARCGMPMNSMVEQEEFALGTALNGSEEYDELEELEENALEEDWILDRDASSNQKSGFFKRLFLVVLLVVVAAIAVQGIRFATATNDRRIQDSELAIAQQLEADELRRIEAYRERFTVVLESYEIQGAVMEENLQNFTKLRINRFTEGLRLGGGFDALMDRLFDVSGVEEMKAGSTTLHLMVQELLDPPNTFDSKYEDLLSLQELEKSMVELFQGDVTSKTKESLLQHMETYWVLLTDLKR